MPTITVEQFFKTYTGVVAQVEADINADIAARPHWFIHSMNVQPGGQGVVAWVLWQKETKA